MAGTLEGKVLLGDIRSIASSLPDDCFQTIVTSPPYFGHRNYSGFSNADELGREREPEAYVENLVAVFRQLRPKLRPDGLMWLNLGDTYRGKSLLGIPWRVALALQDDGWILCILASTREGDFVFDPFTGSGTTGVVAYRLHRKFVGVELSPEYQSMAQRRIDDASAQLGLFSVEGQDATISTSGDDG